MNTKSIKAIDIELGKIIHGLRTSKGVSQKELGKKIGVTHQQIQKYEDGINRMAFSRVAEVAVALDENLAYIARISQDGDGKLYTLDEMVNRTQTLDVMHNYNSIKNKRTQASIASLLKELAG